MERKLIKIEEHDNVAVAVESIKRGQTVIAGQTEVTAQEDIPFGHKIALRDIEAEEAVIKYGYAIGHASCPIKKGSWVHSHNLATNLKGMLTYTYEPDIPRPANVSGISRTFRGYVRKDGNVGIRNEIWIIPTVSCVNTTVRMLADMAAREYGELCDGIYAYPHNAGCSQLGDDFETTQKILASIVHHPNAGGVLLVSLGCENNDLEHFLPVLGEIDESRVKMMVTQDVEGDELEYGMELIRELAQELSQDQREDVPVSKLKIAFKCGGSDAFSGVTANPLCGRIADCITALDGSAVLTEVPEMFGTETILMNRSDSDKTFHQVVELINGFKQYYLDYGQPVYENPSPGNKRGGITTLEEKSLGCIQKGGKAMVTGTLQYGERCIKPGLNLMTGPGNDSVSITDLLSCGAQILFFTTGRGNPLGAAIPTIKIASNNVLYERKERWIDYNAGAILDGKTFDDAAHELWDLMIQTASGEHTKNEIYGYREIMIFKNGVLL